MQTEAVVRAITTRTGISHDDVRTVLDTLRQITKDQLGTYEGLVLPGMMRIEAYHSRRFGWRARVNLFKELAQSVGARIEPVTDIKTQAGAPPHAPAARAGSSAEVSTFGNDE